MLWNITLRLELPQAITKAALAPQGTALALADGVLTVPVIDGYAVVELAY